MPLQSKFSKDMKNETVIMNKIHFTVDMRCITRKSLTEDELDPLYL